MIVVLNQVGFKDSEELEPNSDYTGEKSSVRDEYKEGGEHR